MNQTLLTSHRLNPGKNIVHIWRIDLLQNADVTTTPERFLSSGEMEQARRFHFARDQRRYVVSHAALRLILSHYLDCQPGQVEFVITENGKPLLSSSSLHFNLTHSHEMALVAVTGAGEIGVDLEYIRPLEDLNSLAINCFSEAEYRIFHALPEAEKLPAFFNGWTRKEAYIKALGEGLSLPLQAFSVTLLPSQPARLLEITGSTAEAACWTLQPVDMGGQYAAAFALRTVDVSCEILEFNLKNEIAYAHA